MVPGMWRPGCGARDVAPGIGTGSTNANRRRETRRPCRNRTQGPEDSQSEEGPQAPMPSSKLPAACGKQRFLAV